MSRPSDTSFSRTRRRILAAGVGAAALGSGQLTTRPAAAATPFDSTDPASVLRTVSRMRGSEDGRITMGWLKARRFGVIDAELTPLMGMVTGTFSRYRLLEDGSTTGTSFELAFYTDLESGEVLDTLTMPYTGKTVKVPRLLLGPSRGTKRPVFHEVEVMRDEEERTECGRWAPRASSAGSVPSPWLTTRCGLHSLPAPREFLRMKVPGRWFTASP
jgi:hypothetical protein